MTTSPPLNDQAGRMSSSGPSSILPADCGPVLLQTGDRAELHPRPSFRTYMHRFLETTTEKGVYAEWSVHDGWSEVWEETGEAGIYENDSKRWLVSDLGCWGICWCWFQFNHLSSIKWEKKRNIWWKKAPYIINIQNEMTCLYNLFHFPSKLWCLQFNYLVNLNQLLLKTILFFFYS